MYYLRKDAEIQSSAQLCIAIGTYLQNIYISCISKINYTSISSALSGMNGGV